MTDAPGTVEGGCRCERVRFRLSGAPIFTGACHCRGCQRMSASAYSVSGAWPAEQFEIIAGEPVIGGLHGATRHYFCGHCMSWMFTRPEGFDAFVNVRTTLARYAAGRSAFSRKLHIRSSALGQDRRDAQLRDLPAARTLSNR